ncbi:MAG: purine-binding chemotaxis protein CheW [bacterium]|nr:purine-binding chemotaxis protein CheW [bacterium]
MSAPTSRHRIAAAGKYLFFRKGREEYGIEILRVHEIANAGTVRPRPGQPSCGAGVLDLRGRSVPVVDLQDRLQAGEMPPAEDPVVVVVEMRLDDERPLVGLLVDGVREVRRLNADQILAAPAGGGGCEEVDLIAGLGRTDDGVACLLSADHLLSESELRVLTEAMVLV